MSVYTENLLENIAKLSDKIKEAKSKGESTDSLELEMKELNNQLLKANESLNENKQVLKG